MIENRLNFGWVCFSRVDVVNENLLILMKSAGCHTIIFGIEFGTDENLKETKKDLVISQINDGIKLCRQYGIRTVGTFLMGEENQTQADIDQLIKYSLSLDLDFASYNVYVPRVDDYFQDRIPLLILKLLKNKHYFDQLLIFSIPVGLSVFAIAWKNYTFQKNGNTLQSAMLMIIVLHLFYIFKDHINDIFVFSSIFYDLSFIIWLGIFAVSISHRFLRNISFRSHRYSR